MDEDLTPYKVPGKAALASLPHYPSLKAVGAVMAGVPRTIRAMWRSLDSLDLVWISAGHPFGLLLLFLCLIRGRDAAILVRQDSLAYFRARLPGRAWRAGLLPLWLVDRAFRLAGRRLPVTAVGPQLAEQFGAPRLNVLSFTVNLMAAAAVEPDRAAQLGAPVELLTVGRMEPEKDPETLLAALELLERHQPGHFRLTWVGTGRLREQIVTSAARRGLSEHLSFPGFVAMGEGLEQFYSRADLFVHVALTEGVPQVLGEAMANGLPIIATDVGGVAGELGRA
ncbi:MAG TPA: glycosyltransferase, partial [Solirubrobacterales bacterium]|nr:glycosyltransferase [Solirubrobacterales bacterium]